MLTELRAVVRQGIDEGVYPGATWAYGTRSDFVIGAVGNKTYCPESLEVKIDSIFDLASVSKVVATTSATILLVQQEKISLDSLIAEFIPEFAANGKEKITVGHLLRHDAGLIAFRPYHLKVSEPSQVRAQIYAESLTYTPESKSVYSDLSMITLADVIAKVSGQPFEVFVQQHVFRPLRMTRTGYFPISSNSSTFVQPRDQDRQECVPTESIEDWRRKLWAEKKIEAVSPFRSRESEFIQGEVHDPTATVLGGVAGHAGLFSDVTDLAIFAQSLLDKNKSLFDPEVLKNFRSKQRPYSSRALGWDTKSPEGSSAGKLFGPLSFGHTGYTGTSMWVDPEAEIFGIHLSNRVNPTATNTKIIAYRPRFYDAVFELLKG